MIDRSQEFEAADLAPDESVMRTAELTGYKKLSSMAQLRARD